MRKAVSQARDDSFQPAQLRQAGLEDLDLAQTGELVINMLNDKGLEVSKLRLFSGLWQKPVLTVPGYIHSMSEKLYLNKKINMLGFVQYL